MGFDHVDKVYSTQKRTTDELLTGDEVMAEMDKYFETGGNPRLRPIMHKSYQEYGIVPGVVLSTLKLEKITNGRTDKRAWIRYRRLNP